MEPLDGVFVVFVIFFSERKWDPRLIFAIIFIRKISKGLYPGFCFGHIEVPHLSQRDNSYSLSAHFFVPLCSA